MARILIAEDDAIIRDMMTIVLRGEGYDVQQACDGQGAITMLQSGWQPDLVLLDLLMPFVTGYDVYRWIETALPANQRPPVVILSAALPNRRELPNVAAMLPKPFDISALLGLVARLCQLSDPATIPASLRTTRGYDRTYSLETLTPNGSSALLPHL